MVLLVFTSADGSTVCLAICLPAGTMVYGNICHTVYCIRRLTPKSRNAKCTFLCLEWSSPKRWKDTICPIICSYIKTTKHLRCCDCLWIHPEFLVWCSTVRHCLHQCVNYLGLSSARWSQHHHAMTDTLCLIQLNNFKIYMIINTPNHCKFKAINYIKHFERQTKLELYDKYPVTKHDLNSTAHLAFSNIIIYFVCSKK